MDVRVSIIIPTRKRSDLLEKTVSRLRTQLSNRDELIIVDDKRGSSFARNRGFAKAKGNVIAFLDDDCLADKNWLQTIREVIRKEETSGDQSVYQGKIRYLFKYKNVLSELFLLKRNQAYKTIVSTIHFLNAGNCFMRKSVLDSLAYVFDEKTFPFRGEEMDLAVRLQLAGYSIVYKGAVSVSHYQKKKRLVDSITTAFLYRGRTEGILEERYRASRPVLDVFGQTVRQKRNMYDTASIRAQYKGRWGTYITCFIVDRFLECMYWLGFYYGKAQARWNYAK